ncbi:unnamed protein product [Lampetra fluviatilis]
MLLLLLLQLLLLHPEPVLCTARAMALIPAPLLRVSILLAYFSVLCAYRAVDIPAQQTYGGSWKFLTYINVVIQTCFFAVAVLGDASKFLHKGGSGLAMDQQLTKLTRLRDRIFTVLAFPIGTFVVIAFWAMYSWDREMVHPQVLDSFIPAWLHHGMHRAALPALGDPHDATSLPKQSHGPPRHHSLQRRLRRLGSVGAASSWDLRLPTPGTARTSCAGCPSRSCRARSRLSLRRWGEIRQLRLGERRGDFQIGLTLSHSRKRSHLK